MEKVFYYIYNKFKNFSVDFNFTGNVVNKDKQTTENQKESLYGKNRSLSNPINTNGIIARINSLNSRTTSNKMYSGYNQTIRSSFDSVDYKDVIQALMHWCLSVHTEFMKRYL